MTFKVISRLFKLQTLKCDFFLTFMQLLLQNCTEMAPFMHVLYNLVISNKVSNKVSFMQV